MQNFQSRIYNLQILKKYLLPILFGVSGGAFFGKPLSFFTFYFSFFLFIFIFLRKKEKKSNSFIQFFLFSISFYFFSLLWLIRFLKIYGGFNIFWASLSIFALSVYLSIYFILPYIISRYFPDRLFLYIFPLFFWISEYLRGIIFTGFPWNPIHLPLAYFPFIIQSLSIFGGYGFSAVILFFFLGLSHQLINKKINLIWLSFFIILIVYNFFWIGHKIREDRLKICTVQVQINELSRFTYGEDFEGLRKGLEFSQNINEDMDLVVFPESLFIIPYEKKYSIFNELNKLSLKFPVLLNANIDEIDKSYNSAILIQKEEIKKIYRKNHLVPFGEYIPLRSFFEKIGFKKIARSLLDFDKGKETGIFQFKEPFGVSICYEIIFPKISRREIKEGAKFLVVLTNDSWYGNSLGPYQHFLLAQLKAVEFHRPVVRSALTGISGFIDSHGRVISNLGLGKEGVLSSKIEVSDEKTIYYHIKEYPPFIIILLIVLILSIKRKN